MLGRVGGQPRTARTFISLRTLEIASHLGVVHTFESSADVNPTLPFHMLRFVSQHDHWATESRAATTDVSTIPRGA